jgi:hypothetical protein
MRNEWLVAGVVLAVGAALWLAGRWRLRQRVAHGEHCPQCGQTEWHRRHRNLADHVFGLGMNVRRYRCKNHECHWEGLRFKSNE